MNKLTSSIFRRAMMLALLAFMLAPATAFAQRRSDRSRVVIYQTQPYVIYQTRPRYRTYTYRTYNYGYPQSYYSTYYSNGYGYTEPYYASPYYSYRYTQPDYTNRYNYSDAYPTYRYYDRGRNQNWKCDVFVNCHDAREGRWDGRGPRSRVNRNSIFRSRGERVGSRNRYNMSDYWRRRHVTYVNNGWRYRNRSVRYR